MQELIPYNSVILLIRLTCTSVHIQSITVFGMAQWNLSGIKLQEPCTLHATKPRWSCFILNETPNVPFCNMLQLNVPLRSWWWSLLGSSPSISNNVIPVPNCRLIQAKKSSSKVVPPQEWGSNFNGKPIATIQSWIIYLTPNHGPRGQLSPHRKLCFEIHNFNHRMHQTELNCQQIFKKLLGNNTSAPLVAEDRREGKEKVGSVLFWYQKLVVTLHLS